MLRLILQMSALIIIDQIIFALYLNIMIKKETELIEFDLIIEFDQRGINL